MQTSRFRALAQHCSKYVFGQTLETRLLSDVAIINHALNSARNAGPPSTSAPVSSGRLTYPASPSWPLAFAQRRHATSVAAKGLQKKKRAEPASESDEPSLIRVVLIKDVQNLGQKGDLVYVKRGRMRHEYYPSGEAVYATPQNIAKHAGDKDSRQAPVADERQGLLKVLRALNSKPVLVNVRPSFADPERFHDPPLTAEGIVEAVRRQRNIGLDPSHVMLSGNIDSFGTFKVPLNLRLPDDTQVELTVHVERRTGGKKMAAAAAKAGAAAALAAA